MQFRHNGWIRTAVTFAMLLGAAMFIQTSQPIAFAQSLTSGDISGRVTDPTGAAIPGATVVIKSLDTGATYTSTTNATGGYHTALLQPGTYSIKISGPGFETTSTTAHVAGGAIANGDVKMTLGKSSQTVTVTEAEPLLSTENADITTTFNTKQVQRLPNPGNDLTFVAQTAPGSVMNTSTPSNNSGFGYGNFSSFGLPAVSNTFTVNGMYLNDPFLNLNNSGATNLLLGNNAIASVTVVSNAYGAQYGGLGGAQINEITKSGTNQFHGNALYWWNGRTLNANDYFNNQQGNKRPFDNVNQFAASIGGPIYKNKTFFFGDYEGLRVVLPVEAAQLSPSPDYVACLTTGISATGVPCASLVSASLPNGVRQVPASDVPIYKQILSVYQNAPGYNNATVTKADPNVVSYNATSTNFTHEWLFQGRIDHHIGEKDSLYGTYDMDRGVQATYTDLLDPIFNAASVQPQYSGQLGETHVFTPNITNQFTFALLWYSAIFTDQNLAASKLLVPYSVIFVDGSFGPNFLGGENFVWPQGRNVTNYQFIDDVSVIKGRNNFKFGYYFRRDDVTDYSPSIRTTPEIFASESSFAGVDPYSGANITPSFDRYLQFYPQRLTQPVALYNEAGYFQDEWKPVPNLSITAAVRVEHNSNPVCQTNCFAVLGGDFAGASTDPTTAYNKLISTGRHQAFKNFQSISIQPRVGFAWSPFGDGTSTVVRGGFGMFTDVFPATIADSVLNNTPVNNSFALFGPLYGSPTTISPNPADPVSGETVTGASNTALVTGFGQGASYSTLSASVAGFGAPNFTNPYHNLRYPVYEEWNLEIQRQFGRNTVFDLNYVGNRGYHEPNLNNSVNAYGAPAGFTGINGTAPPNPNFSGVTEVYSNAVSNYNGIVATVQHRSKSLLLQFNYEYSHAMDEISNGGILNFSGSGQSVLSPTNPFNLAQNYGNADYDVRHNITASYVYDLPYYRGPHVITDGWEVSGTVFHHTGFPFTVVDSVVTNSLTNYGSTIFAKQLNNVHTCGGSHVYNLAAGTNTNPCAIVNPANYTLPTAFGQQERNQSVGPSYTDTDMAVLKSFAIPKWESAKFTVGAQFFNLLNHPNFSSPSSDINPTNGFAGAITSTVNTPTSILGSGLGGNAAPRLIQIKGSFEF
ncbi:MAG: carboxypeptidase regulatory-like domain-containing protein [Acidobacteriaceae bacterium]